MKGIKSRDPMKTKTGKTRLGPLNQVQLEDLISKTSQPKLKNKFATRLAQIVARENRKSKTSV